jgi:hypothetical protein
MFQSRSWPLRFASSEKVVGEFRLGKLPKCVIEDEFENAIGAKTVGSSHGDLRPATTPLETSF